MQKFKIILITIISIFFTLNAKIDPTDTNHTIITTINGKKIEVNKINKGFIFDKFKGKIVLLEVYGDSCPHCLRAIPFYNKLQNRYKKDIVIIALESYGSLNNANRQKYITIPKSKSGKMFKFIKDLTGYNLQMVPYLMIFDKNGKIIYNKMLFDLDKEKFKIEDLIKRHL